MPIELTNEKISIDEGVDLNGSQFLVSNFVEAFDSINTPNAEPLTPYWSDICLGRVSSVVSLAVSAKQLN